MNFLTLEWGKYNKEPIQIICGWNNWKKHVSSYMKELGDGSLVQVNQKPKKTEPYMLLIPQGKLNF